MIVKKHLFFCIIFAVFSCKDTALPEPKKLIEKDVMIDILYDIAIIEAIKTSHPYTLQSKGVDTKTYIYKKYKIDSVQFAKSDKYYATDAKQYGKMYQKVMDRIKEQKTKDSLAQLPKAIKKDVNENSLKSKLLRTK